MVDEDCGNLKYCLYEIENSKCLPCIPTDMVGRQLVLSFVVAMSYYNQCLCFKYSITSHDETTDNSHFPSNRCIAFQLSREQPSSYSTVWLAACKSNHHNLTWWFLDCQSHRSESSALASMLFLLSYKGIWAKRVEYKFISYAWKFE